MWAAWIRGEHLGTESVHTSLYVAVDGRGSYIVVRSALGAGRVCVYDYDMTTRLESVCDLARGYLTNHAKRHPNDTCRVVYDARP